MHVFDLCADGLPRQEPQMHMSILELAVGARSLGDVAKGGSRLGHVATSPDSF